MTNITGKRLAQARAKIGLSQKQLGINAGIDEFSASPRINQYERGKHTPDFKTIERLSKVLDIPPPYLYAQDNNLAEMILLFNKLSIKEKKKVLKSMQKMST